MAAQYYSGQGGWRSQGLETNLRVLSEYFRQLPASEQRSPIREITLRLHDSMKRGRFLTYTPATYESWVLKLLNSAEKITDLLLQGVWVRRTPVELLVDGCLNASSKEAKIFHVTILHVVLAPLHLIYDLIPEWTWIPGNKGTYFNSFDEVNGPEVLARSRRVTADALLLFRWYKKAITEMGDLRNLDIQSYYDALEKGKMGVLTQRLVPLGIQVVNATKPNPKSKSRAKNRLKL